MTEIGEASESLLDEYAAIARVATLVAQGGAPADIFAAVSREVHDLFRLGSDGVDIAGVVRFDPGPVHVAVGVSRGPLPVGTRWEPDDLCAPSAVRLTGHSARIDKAEPDAITCPLAEEIREAGGYFSQVASPVMINGRLWGAMSINTRNRLPADTETRLATFTELVAMAIGHVESRHALTELAREQSTLRRVATLVAGGVAFEQVLSAVCEEVGTLLDADAAALLVPTGGAAAMVANWGRSEPIPPVDRLWPLAPDSVTSRVFATGRPARAPRVEVEGPLLDLARRLGLESTVGAPVMVGGRLWGALVVSTRREAAWDEQTEIRVAAFTQLIAMAISNADAVRRLEHVAAEQAGLRRVATLVAQGASSKVVVNAVAAEVGKLLDVDIIVVSRQDLDGSLVSIASWSDSPECLLPVGVRAAVGGHNAMTIVVETGRPARIDDYDDASGQLAAIGRSHGCRTSVAAPIIVSGRVWGVILAASEQLGRFQPGAEGRLAAFSDLVATALANAQAQEDLHRHVQEQAALQRVATLVAQGTPPAAIFSAVSREVEALFDAAAAAVIAFEPDVQALIIVGTSDNIWSSAVGSRYELANGYASTGVYQTGKSARRQARSGEVLDGPVYGIARGLGTGEQRRLTSAVASPLTVAGQLWGAIIVSAAESLPPDTEARLERFADIVATAIANADSRQALATLAAEQAGLRRIATLVAKGVQPKQVFAAVTDEVTTTFCAITAMMRFEQAPLQVVLVGASRAIGRMGIPIGSRWDIDDALAADEVYRTRRSARVDGAQWSSAKGAIGEAVHRLGIVSTVASPIIVEGGLWGVITVNAREELRPDTEHRLEKFTDLVTTAIANAEGKSELASSRRRIVNAGDEARRRIERNLHDGIQQGLIELTFRAQALARKDPELIRAAAVEFAERLATVSDELREVSRGIHPTILSEAGLGPALRALARRSSVPAAVDVRVDERLSDDIEAAAYYVASEAFVNVTKHSQATVVELQATLEDESLRLRVCDNGIGGVDPSRGSGILGIKDRVEALGGSVSISSPVSQGTELSVLLPRLTDTATLLRPGEGDHG